MREGLNFADIEDNSARTEAINEFVDIIQAMPYCAGWKVIETIKDRVIINHLQRGFNNENAMQSYRYLG